MPTLPCQQARRLKFACIEVDLGRARTGRAARDDRRVHLTTGFRGGRRARRGRPQSATGGRAPAWLRWSRVQTAGSVLPTAVNERPGYRAGRASLPALNSPEQRRDADAQWPLANGLLCLPYDLDDPSRESMFEPSILELVDGVDEQEALFAAGLTDGLPVVAPTPQRVEAMLAAGSWAADHVLLTEPTRGLDVLAHQAATCAVLAGAPPEAFPIVGAALQAMGQPEFGLHQPMTSTGGAAIMVIVSGPVANAVAVNGREGLLGPGFRANATIGRTIRLVMMFCLGALPGQIDRSTQGWPGKFSLCFAEHVAASPWEPLHAALGFGAETSTVTVFACESGHNIVNHAAATPESLLLTVSDAMAALGSFSPGRSVVVFAPEHAAKLATMSRHGVQSFLYEHAARTLDALKRAAKIERSPGIEPDWAGQWLPAGDPAVHPGDEHIVVHRGWAAEDILLLVGGGLAGGHSMFFPSWSRGRGTPFATCVVAA